jgi:type I restriction enzyme S subunit
MSEWKKLKLKEIAELRSEKFTPNKITSYPYIGLEHIEPKSLRINGIGVSNDVSSQKSIFYSDDILYGKLRPYFQKVYYSTFKGVCSTDIFVVKSKNVVHPKYLFYLLASDEFTALANQGSTGTRMPRADWKHLASTEWDIPDLPTQTAIAEILSSLDDKIELNNKINQELETLAQTLFKQWFIDFEFPNENGEPYKSSGGEMVDSELGEIPKGWEVGKIGDYIKFIKGKKPIEVFEVWFENTLPQILIETLDSGKSMYARPEKMTICEKEDLIMVMDGACSGRIEIGFKGILGSTLAIIKSNGLNKNILYQFLKYKEQDIRSNTTGAAIPHADKSKIFDYNISIPTEVIETNFSGIHEHISEMIYLSKSELKSLIDLRDTLLPKLISGELEINEISN